MNIKFTFKNFEPSEHLKKYARRRFEKIAKYCGRKSDIAEMQVTMSVEKFRHMAEVLFVVDDTRINATESSEDMYSSVDMVWDKIESQMKKQREKSKDKRRSGKGKSVQMDVFSYQTSESGDREKTIVSTDSYVPKPMNVDEAAMQLDNLQYEFLVFINSETDRVNVMYQRKDGDFGLIDPGT